MSASAPPPPEVPVPAVNAGVKLLPALGSIKWVAAALVAILEFLQKLTPALDFLPRWSSLVISYVGTPMVLIGSAAVAWFLWNEPHWSRNSLGEDCSALAWNHQGISDVS